MTTQNNMPTLPSCLVMMMRKDATALSESMYQAPKKKMLQEELKKVLDVWGGSGRWGGCFEEDIGDEIEADEDGHFDGEELYMAWFTKALDEPWEDPRIKGAIKDVKRLEAKGYYEEGEKEKRDRQIYGWMETWRIKNGFI